MINDKVESTYLKEWYVNFIKLFRQEFANLSEIEKTNISKTHDFTPKCQIEVFWLRQPEWQIIVTTHFEDRPDLEITINGPYESTVFQNEVKKIINHPRWHRPLYRENHSTHSSIPNFYDEFLASRLRKFIEMAKNAMFVDWNVTTGLSESVSFEEGVVEHFFGNIGKFDHKSLVQQLIQDIKKQHEYVNKLSDENTESHQIRYPKGFGVFLFPPIVIGNLLKPTTSDILDGKTDIDFPTFDKKLFDTELIQMRVIVTKDGFIGICLSDRDRSLKILNTIMGVLILDGIEVDIVRDHELANIDYDPQSHSITGYSYNMESTRNELFNGIKRNEVPKYQIREMKEDEMKKILSKVDKILQNEILSNEILLYLESIAHMKDSEFAQSFLMSWKIIEQNLSETWKSEKHVKIQDCEHVKLPRIFDIIDELYSKDKMTKDAYSTYGDLRKLRNQDIHGSNQIRKNDAERCIHTARDLILRSYQFY